MLATLIKKKCLELELSSRQAAEVIGVAHTTVLRGLRGESIDLETLVKFSEWLEVKPHTLLNSMSAAKDSLSDQIAVMLEGNSDLAGEFEKAIAAIAKGRVEPAIVEDIAIYITYVINVRTKRK